MGGTGRRRYDRSSGCLWSPGVNDPCAVVRYRRHHGGQRLRPAMGDHSQHRHGLGADAAGRNHALGDAVLDVQPDFLARIPATLNHDDVVAGLVPATPRVTSKAWINDRRARAATPRFGADHAAMTLHTPSHGAGDAFRSRMKLRTGRFLLSHARQALIRRSAELVSSIRFVRDPRL